ALLGRELLRRQVPEQPAAPARAGERNAGNEAGGAAGAPDSAGGSGRSGRGIDPSDAGPGHRVGPRADPLRGWAALRVPLSGGSAAPDAARFSAGWTLAPGGEHARLRRDA